MKKIVLTLSLVLVITLLFGCTEQSSQIFEPKLTPCSNSQYSTASSPTRYLGGTQNLISWNGSDTSQKFFDNVKEKGNQALVEISDLTCLEYIQVHGDNISDLSPLSNLTNLKMLSLDSEQLTDLSPLENLQKLGHLNLINTPVTNPAALTKLTSLKRLRIIGCANCYKSTPILFDCEKLKSDLPNVNVTCEDSLD